ncbi:endoglucanase [Paenochrobactrum gallinarii]|uniref:cellulase n=1 Tax=Paenochrobactrum gallinarii TaxID=643673 RepID=A0A841M7Z4_9HYPH|nr:glycosyl hydrolase family 8 [Paenochrobactrum gallinarii]MBB6262268.1 endoglucanase [Paenochrobactrum gallinarii]
MKNRSISLPFASSVVLFTRAVLMVLTVCLMPVQSASSQTVALPTSAAPLISTNDWPMISINDWSAYSDKFLTKEGRIVDDANGNISHSEGQGYGLLLAVMAGRPADFELIWSFTQTEMLIRNDGLSSWKWDPAVRPHITDTNNASDGDMLIAYALALAAKKWNNQDYRKSATTIAGTLLKKQIIKQNDETILLPAIRGFSLKERADGPVINLSYWIFEAFPVLNELAPSPAWAALTKSGLSLLAKSRFVKAQLPTDWISVHKTPEPANGFPPEFSYNNLRIVLYLSRAGYGKEQLTQQIAKAMTDESGNVKLVNVTSNVKITSLSEPGYRMIPQLAACIGSGVKLTADVRRFTPTQYYPSTLHLLALSYVAHNHPECL